MKFIYVLWFEVITEDIWWEIKDYRGNQYLNYWFFERNQMN